MGILRPALLLSLPASLSKKEQAKKNTPCPSPGALDGLPERACGWLPPPVPTAFGNTCRGRGLEGVGLKACSSRCSKPERGPGFFAKAKQKKEGAEQEIEGWMDGWTDGRKEGILKPPGDACLILVRSRWSGGGEPGRAGPGGLSSRLPAGGLAAARGR